MKTILMVCEGNLCRSPMAEGFFAHQLTHNKSPITVSSAGLNAVVDYPAEQKAQEIMKQRGIDISEHRARQISDELVRKAGIIFVMTEQQLTALTQKFLSAKGKTFLLGHWKGFEVPDPIMQSQEAFEKVYNQIELAWQDWKGRI